MKPRIPPVPKRPEDAAREFLENSPLFQRVELLSDTDFFTPPDSISLPCEQCQEDAPTTWRKIASGSCLQGNLPLSRIQAMMSDVRGPPTPMGGPAGAPRSPQPRPPIEDFYCAYKCARCDKAISSFWMHIQPSFVGTGSYKVMKIGQWPRWSIRPPAAIRSVLDEKSLDLYKKGRVCLAQGYGIGAFVYFRRVIESQTEHFLEMIREEAVADEDEETMNKVDVAFKEQNATLRLKLAADALPRRLRPGNINPLNRIYNILSNGLHSQSDEECLTKSKDLLDAFDFMLVNMRLEMDAAKVFRASLVPT